MGKGKGGEGDFINFLFSLPCLSPGSRLSPLLVYEMYRGEYLEERLAFMGVGQERGGRGDNYGVRRFPPLIQGMRGGEREIVCFLVAVVLNDAHDIFFFVFKVGAWIIFAGFL